MTERHRTRQHPSRRLEHEELAGDPGIEGSARHPDERVRPDRLDVARPLLVGGGIGIAPLPYLAEALEQPPAVLGFRTDHHAEAAELMPGAEVVIDPVLVTEVMPGGRDVLACGPEPMLEAVRALAPDAQLAWEAPMACGYGACYGCVVEIDGALKRLCVEGPVLCTS
jgi:NAD(P)H-flavin reductase